MNELRLLHLATPDGQYQISIEASVTPNPASLADFLVKTAQPGQESCAYLPTLSRALKQAALWVQAREEAGQISPEVAFLPPEATLARQVNERVR